MAKIDKVATSTEPFDIEMAQDEPTQPTQPTPSVTNWKAFDNAGVMPAEILCQAYKPFHRMDMSCHTKLQLRAESMINHWQQEHGGGFQIKVIRGGKPWPGWKALTEAGVEAVDLRCDVCDAQIPFHPQHILKHMRAHPGKNRRIQEGKQFNLTLGMNVNEVPEDSVGY